MKTFIFFVVIALTGCGGGPGVIANTLQVMTNAPPTQVFEWDGDSQPVGIVIVPGSSDGKTAFRLFADVSWGTRAVPLTVRIDVDSGVQLNVFGDFVHLSVGAEAANDFAVTVEAQMSPGMAVAQGLVTRTLSFKTVGPGVVADSQLLPAFAAKLLTAYCSPTDITLGVGFQDASGKVLGGVAYSFVDWAPVNPNLLLMDGARAVGVVTKEAAADVQLVFELNL